MIVDYKSSCYVYIVYIFILVSGPHESLRECIWDRHVFTCASTLFSTLGLSLYCFGMCFMGAAIAQRPTVADSPLKPFSTDLGCRDLFSLYHIMINVMCDLSRQYIWDRVIILMCIMMVMLS